MDGTQEIEQRAQQAAQAGADHCALCFIFCVISTLASVRKSLRHLPKKSDSKELKISSLIFALTSCIVSVSVRRGNNNTAPRRSLLLVENRDDRHVGANASLGCCGAPLILLNYCVPFNVQRT